MTKQRARLWAVTRRRVYQCLNGRCPQVIPVGRFPLCPACRQAILIGGLGAGLLAGLGWGLAALTHLVVGGVQP